MVDFESDGSASLVFCDVCGFPCTLLSAGSRRALRYRHRFSRVRVYCRYCKFCMSCAGHCGYPFCETVAMFSAGSDRRAFVQAFYDTLKAVGRHRHCESVLRSF